jgi:copper chaperone
MAEITLVAPDISCDHCKRAIESELGTLAGVHRVEVEPAARTVHVVFDDAVVDEPAVRARLDDIGYPVGG